jgi:hypothetical protein
MILKRMDELNELGNPEVIPDSVSYGSVIHAWAKSDLKEAPYQAEALLLRMQELHESGNQHVKPNTKSFNSVLNAVPHRERKQFRTER